MSRCLIWRHSMSLWRDKQHIKPNTVHNIYILHWVVCSGSLWPYFLLFISFQRLTRSWIRLLYLQGWWLFWEHRNHRSLKRNVLMEYIWSCITFHCDGQFKQVNVSPPPSAGLITGDHPTCLEDVHALWWCVCYRILTQSCCMLTQPPVLRKVSTAPLSVLTWTCTWVYLAILSSWL